MDQRQPWSARCGVEAVEFRTEHHEECDPRWQQDLGGRSRPVEARVLEIQCPSRFLDEDRHLSIGPLLKVPHRCERVGNCLVLSGGSAGQE